MNRALIASLVAATLGAPGLAAAEDLAEAMRQWSETFAQDLTAGLTMTYGPRMGSSRLVKGAPYSAQVITETNQPLADGNLITHKTEGAIYRDTEGRTRQELAAVGRKPGTVYISDPVHGKRIVLLPGSKRAVVSAWTPHPDRDVSRETSHVYVRKVD